MTDHVTSFRADLASFQKELNRLHDQQEEIKEKILAVVDYRDTAISLILEHTPDEELDKDELVKWSWFNTAAHDRIRTMMAHYGPELSPEGTISIPEDEDDPYGNRKLIMPGLRLKIDKSKPGVDIDKIEANVLDYLKIWNLQDMEWVPISIFEKSLSEYGIYELHVHDRMTAKITLTSWGHEEMLHEGTLWQMINKIQDSYYYDSYYSPDDDEEY